MPIFARAPGRFHRVLSSFLQALLSLFWYLVLPHLNGMRLFRLELLNLRAVFAQPVMRGSDVCRYTAPPNRQRCFLRHFHYSINVSSQITLELDKGGCER